MPTVLQILEKLHNRSIPPGRSAGICHYINLGKDFTKADYHRYIESWPKFSGSHIYPIPDSRKNPKDAAHMFVTCRTKWDKRTFYGRDRWDLVDHLIKMYSAKA